MSIKELQERCGRAAEAKGFHDDRPARPKDGSLTDWQGNKLMLIVSEVAEAQDELRKGRAADETYHSLGNKPEGVPSELADVVIRVLDFCYTEGIDLETIIEEKLLFNQSRPRLHGKQF